MNRMVVVGANMKGVYKNMAEDTQGEGEVKDTNKMVVMGANMKEVIKNMAEGTQGIRDKDMNRMVVNIFSHKN